jgi:hypothetical protein
MPSMLGTGVDPEYSRRYTTGGHHERMCRDCNGTGERRQT